MVINNNILLKTALTASYKAACSILKIYNSDFNFELKKDNSPITLADKESNIIITDILKTTNIPIISEESKKIPYDIRKNYEYTWIVDPLDGTKEFIKRNGEFAINIALAHKGNVIIGVICVPYLNIIYFASNNIGSYKLNNFKLYDIPNISLDEIIKSSKKLPLKSNKEKIILCSNSHLNNETKKFIEKLSDKNYKIIKKGSSIKFGIIAEGKADIYPRLSPTMEWDTAAGQIIVEQTGKKILNFNTRETLKYNKKDLKNPSFIIE